jgi:hypothetical protein
MAPVVPRSSPPPLPKQTKMPSPLLVGSLLRLGTDEVPSSLVAVVREVLAKPEAAEPLSSALVAVDSKATVVMTAVVDATTLLVAVAASVGRITTSPLGTVMRPSTSSPSGNFWRRSISTDLAS